MNSTPRKVAVMVRQMAMRNVRNDPTGARVCDRRKMADVCKALSMTNETIAGMTFDAYPWNPVPAWARWKATVMGITVWFSHKPVRGTSLMVCAGYPANSKKPQGRRHQTDREFTYGSWFRTIERVKR